MPDDGVSVVPTPTGTEELKPMADPIDLPPNVASALMVETTGNIQANNANGRAVANVAMGVLQAGAARAFNELDAVESRATSGVMATPIASPTTQEAQK